VSAPSEDIEELVAFLEKHTQFYKRKIVRTLVQENLQLHADNARLREALEESTLVDVIRKWKYHWNTKEPGYEGRADIDANMAHHLAKLIAAKALSRAGENEELQKKNKEELAKVEADKLIYGQGSYLQNLDGSITHIPVGDELKGENGGAG
jgi:hypothetical protein